MLIDTAGLAELGAIVGRSIEGVEAHVFKFGYVDIEELARALLGKYGDCGHTSEPGCAVQAPLGEVALGRRSLESQRKSWQRRARVSSYVMWLRSKPGKAQKDQREAGTIRGSCAKCMRQRRKDGVQGKMIVPKSARYWVRRLWIEFGHDVLGEVPGRKFSLYSHFFQGGDAASGMMPPMTTVTSSMPLSCSGA